MSLLQSIGCTNYKNRKNEDILNEFKMWPKLDYIHQNHNSWHQILKQMSYQPHGKTHWIGPGKKGLILFEARNSSYSTITRQITMG